MTDARHFTGHSSDPDPNAYSTEHEIAGDYNDDDAAVIDETLEPQPEGVDLSRVTLPVSAHFMTPADVQEILRAHKSARMVSGAVPMTTGSDPVPFLSADKTRRYVHMRVIANDILRRGGIPVDNTLRMTTAGAGGAVTIPSGANDSTLRPFLSGYEWAAATTATETSTVSRANITVSGVTSWGSNGYRDYINWMSVGPDSAAPQFGSRKFADPVYGSAGGKITVTVSANQSTGNTLIDATIVASGFMLPASGKPFSLAISDDKGMMGATALLECEGLPLYIDDYTGPLWVAPMPSGSATTPQTIPNMTLLFWAVTL